MFKIDKPTKIELEEEFYYMQNTIDDIKNVNIKDFNYIIFEEDLDNMYKTEFLKFFNKNIKALIEDLNIYLSIDLDELFEAPYRIKLSFVKNIVRFFMNTLPYIYMKEFLSSNEVEGLHDALDLFDDNLQTNIINQIKKSQEQYSSFNTMMSDIEDTITNEKKKNKFNNMLTLLDASMTNKSKLLDYYKSIIQNSGHDGIKSLFKLYLKNDLDNIIV